MCRRERHNQKRDCYTNKRETAKNKYERSDLAQKFYMEHTQKYVHPVSHAKKHAHTIERPPGFNDCCLHNAKRQQESPLTRYTEGLRTPLQSVRPLGQVVPLDG